MDEFIIGTRQRIGISAAVIAHHARRLLPVTQGNRDGIHRMTRSGDRGNDVGASGAQ